MLELILANKRLEVEVARRACQCREGTGLQSGVYGAGNWQRRDFGLALCPAADWPVAVERPVGVGRPAGPGAKVIAEVKRASPSKGLLAPGLDAAALARAYESAGAAAISVLTDHRFFGGSLEDLASVKRATGLPVLRKDFIIDSWQLKETVQWGADAVLLIVAALGEEQLEVFLREAADLGLACLVEVHDEKELAVAVRAGAGLIGINNRNLQTMQVDLTTCERLAPLVPPEAILVGESGIRTAADVHRLASWGVNAVLVGEALVTARSPADKLRDLVEVKPCLKREYSGSDGRGETANQSRLSGNPFDGLTGMEPEILPEE